MLNIPGLIKKSVVRIVLGLLFSLPAAAETSLLPVRVDPSNQAALRHGAQLFMNYCAGCHSLRYIRYSKIAEDVGLTGPDGQIDKEQLRNNLIFTKATIDAPIIVSMSPVDARQWFGVVPPDLSLTARARGTSWVYTYLKSFYADDHRPFGVNNSLLPNVAMPNVLAPLREDKHLTTQELDSAITDLVTFLSYVADPEKANRQKLGIWVLFFIGIWLIAMVIIWRKLFPHRH
jgi:ubiquinol-cytochrome c reductase cytochrome c1 subunit